MTLLDFEDYAKVKDQALSDYEDRTAWAEKTACKHRKSRILFFRQNYRGIQQRYLASDGGEINWF